MYRWRGREREGIRKEDEDGLGNKVSWNAKTSSVGGWLSGRGLTREERVCLGVFPGYLFDSWRMKS